MAWFGGGLSKLTDEISNLGNLTREVLSDSLSNQDQDEASEVAEEALQRRSSNVSSNIPELEEKVKVQEDEIETLKRENDALMKRLADQMLSLDQASPRSTIARSFQSAVDNWGAFDDEDDGGSGGRRTPKRRTSGPQFPGGDFEFDDQKEETQDELTSLRSQIELLEKENEDLLRETAEIPELRSRIKQLHKENNLLIKSTDKFQREAESSKKLLDEQKESIIRLESQVSQMQHDLAAQSSTIAELTEENSQLREDVNSTQDENSNLSTGIEQLDMQHSRDLQDLMDSKRDADRRIIVLEEELSNLRSALAEKSAVPAPDNSEAGMQTDPELPPLEPCQRTTGSDNSDELSEAYDMLQTELDDLKAKIQEVPNVEDYTEKVRVLTDEVTRLKTKENELHTRIEELEEKLREKDEEEKTIGYQIEEKSIEISQLTEHNRRIQQEIDTLKDKLRDLSENVDNSNTNNVIVRKDELIEKLKAELEEVQKELKEKKSEGDWGSSDVWGAKNDKKEYNKLVQEKQELTDTIQDQEKIIADLEAKIEKLTAEYVEKISQQDEVAATQKSQLETLGVRLTEMERSLQEREDNAVLFAEVEDEIRNLKEEILTIKTFLAEERELNAKLKAHSESLQKQLLEKEAEIEDWGGEDAWGSVEQVAQLKNLEEDNAALTQQVVMLQTQLQSVEVALKEAQKSNDAEDWGQGDDWGFETNSNSDVNELKRKCKEQEDLITELKTKEEILKQSLTEKEELSDWGDNSDWGTANSSEMNSLQEKLTEQKTIIAKLKAQLETQQGATTSQVADDRDNRIDVLSRDNESLRTRVEQLGLVIENNYVEETDPVNLIAEKERLDEEVNMLSRENAELKKKLEVAIEKQKGLEEEITQLEEDINTQREQMESKDHMDDSIESILRNEIKDLHTKLLNSDAIVNQLQVDKQALNIKYEELNEKYENIEQKLKSQFANDTIDIDTLIKNLQSKEEELCKLLDEKNTLDNIRVEKENLEVQIDNLSTNYQDKINNLIQDKQDLEEKIVELNNGGHNKSNEINDLNKRISWFEENNSFLQRTNSELERNLEEKKKELNEFGIRLQEKEIDYNEKVEASNHRIQELVQENDNLNAQVKTYIEKIEHITQEKSQLEAAPVDDGIMNENELLRTQIENVRQEANITIKNLQKQIKHKDQEINIKVAEQLALTEKCNKLEGTISAKLTDFSNKEQLNENKILNLSKLLQSLQDENQSVKQMNEKLQSHSQITEQERTTIDFYKQRVEELTSQLGKEVEEKTHIAQRLDAQVQEMNLKLTTYTNIEEELVKCQNIVYELEQTRDTLLGERTKWIHEFELKNKTVADLQQQLDEYNKKLALSSQVDAGLNELTAQVQDLEEQKQDLLRQIQNESNLNNSLRNELEALRGEFIQTKTSNEHLVKDKQTLVDMKNTLETRLNELVEKEKQYLQKLTESEETTKKLSEEVAILNVQPPNPYGSIEEVLKEKDNSLSEMLKKCAAKDSELEKLQQLIDHHLAEKHQFEKQVIELKNNLSAYENQSQLLKATTDDLKYQLQEKDNMIRELNEMKQSFFIGDSKDSVRQTPQDNPDVTALRSELTAQRTMYQQLVDTVTIKHKENISYHQEIQRLNAVLSEETTRRQHLSEQVMQSEKTLKAQGEALSAKEQELATTQEQLFLVRSQLEEVTQHLSSHNRPAADGEPAQERELTAQHVTPAQSSQSELTSLARDRDELSSRVHTLQEEKAMLLNEVNDLRLKQNSLVQVNERLQKHLLQVEQDNTAELLKAEQRVEELTAKLREADERAKHSASAYTSASVRTNQQLESLNSQVKSLSEQREKLQERLSAAEDQVEKHKASLTSLQIVLEQFQADKDNEIAQGLEMLQAELNNSYTKNHELTQNIHALQLQLQEARDNLAHMDRLSNQLQEKSQMIDVLNAKVAHLTEELDKNELKLKEVNNGGKVDKCLVTNMLVNFLTAPSRPARNQALQILATVIEMTAHDRQRIGLDPPSAYNPNQSLSEAFIQFLENESSPRGKASTPASRRTSTTASPSPLLFPESALPTLPQFPTNMSSGSILKDVLHSDS